MSNDKYYGILGVDKNASKQEIVLAYKKKAKQYHSDINKSPNAETKFKEVNEAYEVLLKKNDNELTIQQGSLQLFKRSNSKLSRTNKGSLKTFRKILIFNLRNFISYVSVWVFLGVFLTISIFTSIGLPIIFEAGYSFQTFYDSGMFAQVYCVSTFVIIVFMCSYISTLGTRKNELKFILQKNISKDSLLLCSFVSNLIFSLCTIFVILLPFFSILTYFQIRFHDIFVERSGVNIYGLIFSFIALIFFSTSLVTSFGYFIRNSVYLLIIACISIIIYVIGVPFLFPFQDNRLQLNESNVFKFTSIGCLFFYIPCPFLLLGGILYFRRLINF